MVSGQLFAGRADLQFVEAGGEGKLHLRAGLVGDMDGGDDFERFESIAACGYAFAVLEQTVDALAGGGVEVVVELEFGGHVGDGFEIVAVP